MNIIVEEENNRQIKENNNKSNIKNELKNENINNYIIAELYIKEEDINKNIRIINSFEEYKRKAKFSDNKNDYKYKNEKEIKENCQIKVNDKIIPFNYFYYFQKKEIIRLNIYLKKK